MAGSSWNNNDFEYTSPITGLSSGGEHYRQRVMEDSLEVERAMRSKAEGQIRKLLKLVKDMAFLAAGEDIENLRTDHPGEIDGWGPENWRQFIMPRLQSALYSNKGWGQSNNGHGNSSNDSERIAAMDKSIEELRNALKVKDNEIKNLNDSIANLSRENGALRKKSRSRSNNNRNQQPHKAEPVEVVGIHDEAHQKLKSIKFPKPPAEFQHRLAQGAPDRYRRQMMTLYLLSRYGFNNRVEIDRIISAVEDIGARSFSVRRPIDELESEELVVTTLMDLKSPFSTSLKVLRLTDDGKALCKALGWEVVSSEWEQVIQGHQGEREKKHTLGILTFTMHARLRGWQVELLPKMDGPAQPDVKVVQGEETYLVEVEGSKKPNDKKWKNIAAAHPEGKVAICAFDPQGRKRLVGDCKLAELSGVATDLKTLIFGENTKSPISIVEINPEMKLWHEHF